MRDSLPSVKPYFGINPGPDLAMGYLGTPLSQAVKNTYLADADYFISLGIKHIRCASMAWAYVVGSPAYGQDRQSFFRELALRYLNAGVDVQWFCIMGSISGSSSYQKWYPTNQQNDAFKAYLALEAAWAESVGITRFQIENELEINRYYARASEQDCYTWMQELCSIVRGAGFTGAITASLVPDNFNAWKSNGIGDFDDLGLDSYGTYAQFVTKNNDFKSYFGENTYLSEWGSQNPDYYYRDPRNYEQEIMLKNAYINKHFANRPNYYFAWKYAGRGNGMPYDTEGDDARAACTEYGEKRYFWYSLLGGRNPLYM